MKTRESIAKLGQSDEQIDAVSYNFNNGDPYKILIDAEGYQTIERKLKYLRWILMQYYGSPEYVLREEIASIEKKKHAEEFLNDPVEFKRQFTHKITPANEAAYEMTYFKEEDSIAEPWLEILREIGSLETEKAGSKQTEGARSNKTRRPQDIHFEIIEPFLKNSDSTFSITGLSIGMNIDRNTFYNWYTTGHKIHPDFNKQQWEHLGYEIAIRTKKLLLRVSPDKTSIKKKDIVKFLQFIGKIIIE
jgi:hypothetical protein